TAWSRQPVSQVLPQMFAKAARLENGYEDGCSTVLKRGIIPTCSPGASAAMDGRSRAPMDGYFLASSGEQVGIMLAKSLR
ncbi:MAG: hypothetical protein AAFO09_07885, partial [Pseudomonadota bacterium]